MSASSKLMDEVSELKRKENEALAKQLEERFENAKERYHSNPKRVDFSKTIEYKSGNVYKGEVVFSKPHGFGTKTYPNGKKYVGEFKDGEKYGIGVEYLKNGSFYLGEWEKNVKSGHGIYTKMYDLGSSTIYNGKWKDNKRMVKVYTTTQIEHFMRVCG